MAKAKGKRSFKTEVVEDVLSWHKKIGYVFLVIGSLCLTALAARIGVNVLASVSEVLFLTNWGWLLPIGFANIVISTVFWSRSK